MSSNNHATAIATAQKAHAKAVQRLSEAYNTRLEARAEKADDFAARVEAEQRSLKFWASAAVALAACFLVFGCTFPASLPVFVSLAVIGVYPAVDNLRRAKALEPTVRIWREVAADGRRQALAGPLDEVAVMRAVARDARRFSDPTPLWGQPVVDAIGTVAERTRAFSRAITEARDVGISVSASQLDFVRSLDDPGHDLRRQDSIGALMRAATLSVAFNEVSPPASGQSSGHGDGNGITTFGRHGPSELG